MGETHGQKEKHLLSLCQHLDHEVSMGSNISLFGEKIPNIRQPSLVEVS